MLDIFNTPTPQGANYQEFYGGGSTRDWIKPRGASMARMLLIGAGGGGSGGGVGSANGGNGGGSGAITEWIGPAIFIPDVLRVSIGLGGTGGTGSTTTTANAGTNGAATSIIYQAKDGTGYTLLTVNGGGGGGNTTVVGAAGAASSNNYFGASGIFSSIAGHAGVVHNTGPVTSTTTFLSGGSGGYTSTGGLAGSSCTPNYGYPAVVGVGSGGAGGDGYFITQPIMVGCGGAGGGGYATGFPVGGNGGKGGIGCGGGGGGRGGGTGAVGGAGGNGGDGAVFIWSW